MTTKCRFNPFPDCFMPPGARAVLSGGFALLLFWIACPALADVYKWVDPQGLVHYSDEPEAGAKRIELPELSIVPFGVPVAPVSEPSAPTSPAGDPSRPQPAAPTTGVPEPKETATPATPRIATQPAVPKVPAPDAGTEPDPGFDLDYRQLAIQVPANNHTLAGSSAELDIALALQPDLRPEDRIQLFLDGRLFLDELQTTRFNISGFAPGSHILEVRIVSPEGATRRRSRSILFHYQP